MATETSALTELARLELVQEQLSDYIHARGNPQENEILEAASVLTGAAMFVHSGDEEARVWKVGPILDQVIDHIREAQRLAEI